MHVRSFSLLVFITLFALYGCTNSADKKNILGMWNVHKWVVPSTGQALSQKMVFFFTPEGKYIVDYQTEKEFGKYWITGKTLSTVENGASEKTIKILRLEPDTMLLEMNRAGRIEVLTLVKEQ
jgi:uncharacterized lipoprotein NlpE involved in copper resistance